MNNSLIKNIVLGIVVLVFVVGVIISGNNDSLSESKKAEITDKFEKIVTEYFIQEDVDFEITSVVEENGIYKLNTLIDKTQDGQPLYVTKDQKKIILETIDIEELMGVEEEIVQVEVIKTEKPEVELFVMSYCPFGTQAEKGYLPVVEKLGDKIDANIRFVNYIMHGEKESDENVREYCIAENEPEKFNRYLSCFLEEGDSEDCLNRNQIDKVALDKCVIETDDKFEVTKYMKDEASWLSGQFPQFKLHDNLNKKYGVGGSPTLVINGTVIENQARDSNSILKSVCSGFENPPVECEESISNKIPSTGFGYGEAADSQIPASCDI